MAYDASDVGFLDFKCIPKFIPLNENLEDEITGIDIGDGQIPLNIQK